MSKQKTLQNLFDIISNDLKSVFPEKTADLFICPICLRKFSLEHIKIGDISDAHVWPKSIREKSRVAASQHVLLCKQCNNFAGSFGDK